MDKAIRTPYACVACGSPKSDLSDELCVKCRAIANGHRSADFPEMNNAVLREAIATYGKAYQVDRAIEEMSELTKALCKERRTDLILGKHAEAHANVIEEIADVLIMLRQLIIIFDRDNELPAEVNYKIQRLQQRLDKAKGETV